mmetsp:Transcript_6459/g.10408  ORF Transcript_6459/g.10408 Transcript_6459/m.10408 type:complete len:244 (+) Transcript_6459:573-1304(+)
MQSNKDSMIDQSIKMVCDTHKAPAVFFSEKEDRYVCFKCLVASEKLLYIDKSYKKDMDDFERIKSTTEEAIKSNGVNTTIIREWKRSIRSCLMRIKEGFNDSIDLFIRQFSDVFKNVEMSTDLLEFRGEDKRMLKQVEDLQKKYLEIQKIFSNITSSPAQKRIEYIDSIKPVMKGIERKVIDQDKYIKNQGKKLREAIDKTVSLENIDSKMELKLIKFLGKEHKKKYSTKADLQALDDTQTIF